MHTTSPARLPDPRVFAALGDPTRLGLVHRLGAAPALSTTGLAEGTGMSRQAIRKHLGVLHEAGLVRHTRRGRERLWSLNAAPLRDVRDWADQWRRLWEDRFDRLEAYLQSQEEGAVDDDRDR